MKRYKKPDMEIIEFKIEDVITTSQNPQLEWKEWEDNSGDDWSELQ